MDDFLRRLQVGKIPGSKLQIKQKYIVLFCKFLSTASRVLLMVACTLVLNELMPVVGPATRDNTSFPVVQRDICVMSSTCGTIQVIAVCLNGTIKYLLKMLHALT